MNIGDFQDRKDRPAYVKFEVRAVENVAASNREGRYVANDVEFVLLTPPYSKDVLIFEVDTWFSNMKQDVDNGRLPREWADNYRKQYDFWKQGLEAPLDGTPIRGWQLASPAQQEALIRMNVRTVEDLAGMNDDGIRRFGMGGTEMRNKARAWLAQSDTGKSAARMSELEAENERLKRDIADLREAIASIKTAQPVGTRQEAPPPRDISVNDLVPDDDLVGAYTAKFGKPPHHKMKPETIRAALGS